MRSGPGTRSRKRSTSRRVAEPPRSPAGARMEEHFQRWNRHQRSGSLADVFTEDDLLPGMCEPGVKSPQTNKVVERFFGTPKHEHLCWRTAFQDGTGPLGVDFPPSTGECLSCVCVQVVI
jgi:hypothetical protein